MVLRWMEGELGAAGGESGRTAFVVVAGGGDAEGGVGLLDGRVGEGVVDGDGAGGVEVEGVGGVEAGF